LTINGENLKKAVRSTGMTVQEAADKLGVSRQMLYIYYKSGELEPDLLQNVREKLGIDLHNVKENFIKADNLSDVTNQIPKSNGLIIGEIGQGDEESPFIQIGPDQYIMVVPLVPIKAQAGYINNYNDENYIQENFTQKHSFAVSRVYRGKYMAFIVDGDSMDDGTKNSIPEGSTVTGREIQKHHWRNKFHIHRYQDYIIVHEDGIFVKQITKHDTEKGIITCHSLNQNKEIYADFDLNLDQCLQIFNVVNVTQTK